MPREPDDYIARANRRSGTYDEGVKGLLVLNGGGALALLTFTTQLMASGQDAALVKTAIVSIAFLVVGLLTAAPINSVRYETSRLYDNDHTKERGKRLGRVHRGLFWASLASFAVGVGIALIGMWAFGTSGP